ncbi:hypothetical protein NBRC116590_22160 [Pelagimonas sp. KU-00592-HH]|uniref:helix-turn-helix domain-containing protein n=1 Tax=Pelagimonas sp. KU-00592-HH TaxID=3127651 RepID=UPI00310A88B5
MSLIDEFLGQSIASLRAKRGLSRMGLAMQLGVAEKHVADLEAGRIRASVTQLFKIADILGVAIETFFASKQESRGVAGTCPEFLNREAREIVDHYNALSKPHRSALFDFLVESKLDGRGTPTQLH